LAQFSLPNCAKKQKELQEKKTGNYFSLVLNSNSKLFSPMTEIYANIRQLFITLRLTKIQQNSLGRENTTA